MNNHSLNDDWLVQFQSVFDILWDNPGVTVIKLQPIQSFVSQFELSLLAGTPLLLPVYLLRFQLAPIVIVNVGHSLKDVLVELAGLSFYFDVV